jgi:hypothetical protein
VPSTSNNTARPTNNVVAYYDPDELNISAILLQNHNTNTIHTAFYLHSASYFEANSQVILELMSHPDLYSQHLLFHCFGVFAVTATNAQDLSIDDAESLIHQSNYYNFFKASVRGRDISMSTYLHQSDETIQEWYDESFSASERRLS